MLKSFLPNPGHFLVFRFDKSADPIYAVNILIFACFFSTISSPGSKMNDGFLIRWLNIFTKTLVLFNRLV